MVTGINHITLSIRNAERSFIFFRDILGFKPIAKWPKGSYFLAGNVWLALVLEKRRKSLYAEYSHIAFTVSKNKLKYLKRIFKKSNVRIWQDNKTEGDSIYFCDPDGHKLELHCTNLKDRIKAAKANPWPGLNILIP